MQRYAQLLKIIFAAATAALALILCLQCADIYREGISYENMDENGVYIENIYTREKVASRLNGLAPLFGVWAVLAVAAAAAAPYAKLPSPPQTEPENRLRLLKARRSSLPEEAMKEERLRKRLRIAAVIASALCAAYPAAHLLNGSNFTSWDLEPVLGGLLAAVLPWTAAAFIIISVISLLCARSIGREIALIRVLPAVPAPKPVERHVFPKNAVRIALYAAAVLLIVSGVLNGGMRDVLVKAINICTECIGLG